jgi:hypothetical protein
MRVTRDCPQKLHVRWFGQPEAPPGSSFLLRRRRFVPKDLRMLNHADSRRLPPAAISRFRPPKNFTLKSLTFPTRMFRRARLTKQFSFMTKPFSAFEQTAGNNREVSNCLQAADGPTTEWRD